jgi:hypothetical protein
MASKIQHAKFEFTPQWNSIQIEQKFSTWSVNSHSDGDVEIECYTQEGSNQLFLNQMELQEFIEFLQSKIIKI